jgi:hypothetical protein
MVMTRSLLVDAIAQRRLRARLAQTDETRPNPINVPTKTPTLRWVFQMLEGIHRVVMMEGSIRRTFIEGLTALRQKILRLFGNTICRHYEISWAES